MLREEASRLGVNRQSIAVKVKKKLAKIACYHPTLREKPLHTPTCAIGVAFPYWEWKWANSGIKVPLLHNCLQ